MPVDVGVRVAGLPRLGSRVHCTLVSAHPFGIVSLMLSLFVPSARPMTSVCTVPAPVVVSEYDEGWPVGTGLTTNGNVPAPSAVLLMMRKPLPGAVMQSNGLLLPPLPADG